MLGMDGIEKRYIPSEMSIEDATVFCIGIFLFHRAIIARQVARFSDGDQQFEPFRPTKTTSPFSVAGNREDPPVFLAPSAPPEFADEAQHALLLRVMMMKSSSVRHKKKG